ncbi:hypothetical protein ACIQ1H_09155 [Lysinibacillus sp. NPDC097279]|uniref:hypothetical protein n=1 Tax=Lysinibacillus sp. NPDC097279 TaxID=3364143 RepID=UPI00380863E6
MSLSKRSYESGYYRERNIEGIHTFQKGQQFEITNCQSKSVKGIWEITNECDLKGMYYCNRVLKNGKLSKSFARKDFRVFGLHEIYNALSEKD